MPSEQPKESDSPLAEKERIVKRRWFADQPEREQERIITPAFEQAHPTDAAKKQAAAKYL